MTDFVHVLAGDYLYATYNDANNDWHIKKVKVIRTEADNVWLKFAIDFFGKDVEFYTHKLNKNVWKYLDGNKQGIWVSSSLEEIKHKYKTEVEGQLSAMRAQVDILMMKMIDLARKEPKVED